ncbi:MAG: InlB B-repeat-containing protein, partial [Bifidobacterium sp.]|nr:InlB B-repeat-containing protein [Bifidobacterium sp.]
QAASIGNSIIAADKQGDVFTWNLDDQGQDGKRARLDTNVASALESASMDGQPLTLKKTGGVWQTKATAHKPGPAAILIAGKQDGKPFSRSLGYTVSQPQARDAKTEASHTVSFKTDGGNPKPEDQNISYPYGRVQRPTTDPTREGYQFDGWFIDEVAYDFSKPVTDNLTLTAHWTSKSASDTWSINPNKGSQLGGQKTTITPPANTNGIKFNQTSGGGDPMQSQIGYSLAVGSDGNAYAWGNNLNGQLGDGTTSQRTTPVMVKKPDRKTYTDVPADFTYVQVSAGGQHSLALGSDGFVYAWGWNYYGQLGNGGRGGYSTAPVRVQNPNNSGEGLKAIQISAGLWNSMALGDDGTVYTWGSISKDGYTNNGTNPQTIPSTVKDPSG